MRVKDFRELDVYKSAFISAMTIYTLTKNFPREEKYSLTDQIRRSSRSICANIAEAWRKRQYSAMFAHKLSDADAEAAETLVWIDFAKECQYIDNETWTNLMQCYEKICGQLTIMIRGAKQWKVAPADEDATPSTLNPPPST